MLSVERLTSALCYVICFDLIETLLSYDIF